jgi:predicted methyltransferase MtxX (methanogen marker protein 4)
LTQKFRNSHKEIEELQEALMDEQDRHREEIEAFQNIHVRKLEEQYMEIKRQIENQGVDVEAARQAEEELAKLKQILEEKKVAAIERATSTGSLNRLEKKKTMDIGTSLTSLLDVRNSNASDSVLG